MPLRVVLTVGDGVKAKPTAQLLLDSSAMVASGRCGRSFGVHLRTTSMIVDVTVVSGLNRSSSVSKNFLSWVWVCSRFHHVAGRVIHFHAQYGVGVGDQELTCWSLKRIVPVGGS